jgi:hypothetical protein
MIATGWAEVFASRFLTLLNCSELRAPTLAEDEPGGWRIGCRVLEEHWRVGKAPALREDRAGRAGPAGRDEVAGQFGIGQTGWYSVSGAIRTFSPACHGSDRSSRRFCRRRLGVWRRAACCGTFHRFSSLVSNSSNLPLNVSVSMGPGPHSAGSCRGRQCPLGSISRRVPPSAWSQRRHAQRAGLFPKLYRPARRRRASRDQSSAR